MHCYLYFNILILFVQLNKRLHLHKARTKRGYSAFTLLLVVLSYADVTTIEGIIRTTATTVNDPYIFSEI